MQGTVYLLHFDRPISDRHTCQHYLGWARDLPARLAVHRAGLGARLTQIAVERGIPFNVVASWPGDRTLERRLKNRKHSPRLCPICSPLAPAQSFCEQLRLDLDGAYDWHAPPALTMDSYEFLRMRRWRERPSHAPLADDWDTGLL
jgi:predicted GIY-YIG superfamily endonuclease